MKKIILLFFIVSFNMFAFNSNYKVNYSGDTSGKLDINIATRNEMLKSGISESYITKIIEFREIVGRIENLKELDKINGIGIKTVEKFEKYFIINEIPEYKTLYINKADDKVLSYFGLDKKQIKKLRKYFEENKRIKNNLELKKILSDKQYRKLRDIVSYDMY